MKALVIIISIVLAGCANPFIVPDKLPEPYLENNTSGLIGCPPEEIKITNSTYKPGANVLTGLTWTAECRGKIFYCSWPVPGGPRCSEAR